MDCAVHRWHGPSSAVTRPLPPSRCSQTPENDAPEVPIDRPLGSNSSFSRVSCVTTLLLWCPSASSRDPYLSLAASVNLLSRQTLGSPTIIVTFRFHAVRRINTDDLLINLKPRRHFKCSSTKLSYETAPWPGCRLSGHPSLSFGLE